MLSNLFAIDETALALDLTPAVVNMFVSQLEYPIF
jgi:hypothetical protein